MPRTSLILALLAVGGAAAAAQAADPAAALLARADATVAALQGYSVEATLEVRVRRGDEARTTDYTLSGAAAWPDRLRVSQDGGGAQVRFGTGPDGGWFHLSQFDACYLGDPVPLDREAADAGAMDFLTSGRFSFLAGLAPSLPPHDQALEVEFADSTLTVGDREVACRVLAVPPAPPAADPEQVRSLGSRYWVDPASGLVLRSEVKVTARRQDREIVQTATYQVRALALEPPGPDADFTYDPPPGVRVADHPDRLSNPEALTGLPAPDVVFHGLDGRETRISDYRGRVLFLDVWATWCPPCRVEMPHLQALHEELAPGGDVAFLAVSSEDPDVIRGFLQSNPYTFPVARVSAADAAVRLKATTIPTGLVIDREGIVRAHLVGAQDEAQLRAALARAGVPR